MVTAASILGVRAPAMMVVSHWLTGRGRILALTGPRHQPGGASVHAGDCLVLPLVMTLVVI
jgi:hypothetical protein